MGDLEDGFDSNAPVISSWSFIEVAVDWRIFRGLNESVSECGGEKMFLLSSKNLLGF